MGESTPPVYVVTLVKPNTDCRQYQQLYTDGLITDSSRVVTLGYAEVIDRMVPVVKRILRAAKRDSVDLKVTNGYRTFAQQLIIRSKHVRGKQKQLDLSYLLYAHPSLFYPATGKPGHSKHQNGIAYDFNVINDDIAYAWMVNNAFRFGFVRTVPSERWHWEYLPSTPHPYYYVSRDSHTWIFYGKK